MLASLGCNVLQPIFCRLRVQCSANGSDESEFNVSNFERIESMLPPHWLDKVFSEIDHCEDQLTGSSQFKTAISKAKTAYREAVEFQKANPNVVGASPAQKARQAFLEVINGN
jgi:hypothetical protein